jgi:hypothetical protein
MSTLLVVPKVFSPQTLEKFEAAAASVPLRPLIRAFENTGIRMGQDPGGPEGARRGQFRRYIAGVDQHDAQQRGRLAEALGALIAEVAISKQEYLVKAAESDGFVFADGVFLAADDAPRSFAIARVEDFTTVVESCRQLKLLAADSPRDAIAAAREIAESLCRTILSLLGKPPPRKTATLVDIADAALDGLDVPSSTSGDAKKDATLTGNYLRQNVALIAGLRSPSARSANLAIDATGTFAAFVIDADAERAKRRR